MIPFVDQETIAKNSILGKDSNALVWPRDPPDDEEDEEGPENYTNQRFMRLGMFSFFFLQFLFKTYF